MEPERPIEKLLRAWAKKRRDDAGAPLELHPATRRLLQGEVARRFGKEPRQPRSFSQVLAGLWPRLAWGVAVVALAGVLAAIVLPTLRGTKKTATFASNERGMLARNEEAVSAPSPAGGPAAAPTTVNAPASEVRLAYDKSAAGEQGKEALGLRDERVEKEKNGSLTLAEPPAKEKAPAFSVAAADTFKDSEGARRDASGVLHETPAATLESEAFRRRSGLADNPVSSQDQLAAPAQQPTALGGALADRPLAGGKLSLDTHSQPAAQTASAASAVKPTFTDEISKQVKGETAPVELALKSPTQPSAPVPPARATESDSRLARLGDDLKKSKQLGVVQRFTQVDALSQNADRAARQPSSAAAVLVSFQMEQSGQDLRIVDGDGSVYTGYVRVAKAAAEAVAAGVEKPAVARTFRMQEGKLEQQKAALAAGQPAPQSYFFSVAGTNRSLNQKVVFSGDLLTTNATFLMAITNRVATSGSGAKDQLLPAEAMPFPALPLPNFRVSGRASVGGRAEVPINAVPTAR